jgi:predicted phage terminase large subunit-like protein
MLYNWYRAELSARLKPRGRVVLIMTRWHEDDLAGRLLASEPGWTCLKLPAIAGKDDALGRVEGEVLWPEWQDEAAVLRTRREVGEKMFAALYQQAPRPSEAAYFNTHTIKVLAEAPEFARTIRAWDLAATLPGAGRNPDYTVGLKLGMAADGRLIVADVVRFQGTPAQVEAKIQEVARRDGAGTVQALPQDPGQAGAAQIATLTRGLGGLRVVAGPEMGAKVNRAMPAATQIDAGMLAIVDAPWNDVFLQELSAFPSAAKDDQVDALSRAVNVMMTTVGQAARRVAVPLLGR